jgi:large subunit ribosomal protein L21
MYAIVKTGGKQYRVEQGQSLLIERLPVSEGDSVTLDPLLYVDGSKVVDQIDGLSSVKVEARVVAHERGPKLRVVKFKPKRGYKRRNGHRQDLTRIEVVGIKLSGGRAKGTAKAAPSEETPAPVAAKEKAAAAEKATVAEKAPAGEKAPVAEKAPAGEKAPVAEKAPAGEKPKARRAAKPKAAAEPEAAGKAEAATEAETTAKAEAKPAAEDKPAPKPRTPRTRAPKKTSEKEGTDGT